MCRHLSRAIVLFTGRTRTLRHPSSLVFVARETQDRRCHRCRIVGCDDQSTLVCLRNGRHLAVGIDGRNVRLTGGEDRVELAGHNKSGKATPKRDETHVGRGIGPFDLITRLVRQDHDIRKIALLDRLFERRAASAVADKKKRDFAVAAKTVCGFKDHLEILRVPEIAGVENHERRLQIVRPCEGIVVSGCFQ